MDSLTITPLNDVWMRVDTSDAIAKELSAYFEFDVPGAQFMKRQMEKRGMHGWSGKIRLFDLRYRRIYCGLVSRLGQFASERGYTIEGGLPEPESASWDQSVLYDGLHLPLTPHDYQWAGLHTCLDKGRCILVLPTGSGKSYSIYLLTQALNERTLIIVPTLTLISQMVSDFTTEYGYTDPIHAIYGGQDKNPLSMVTVSTWQSIYQQPEDWFNQFGCVIVDEVHQAKAKSLKGIMEKCTMVPYRFGFTGTLDKTECHQLVLEGLFGDVVKIISTAELQKQKRLTPIHVTMCMLTYDERRAKALRREAYADELADIVPDPARQEFVARLATEVHGNTLVLFQFVQKQGRALFARLKALADSTGRQVHYIAGSVDAENREAIRRKLSQGDNHIIVASYGTFQLGVNIPRLKNLIFAHPAKSPVRVLQSIGRILRLAEGKDLARLYDLVDDLRIGHSINHLFKHGQGRMNLYASEQFPVVIKPVDMSTFARLASTAAQTPLGDAA